MSWTWSPVFGRLLGFRRPGTLSILRETVTSAECHRPWLIPQLFRQLSWGRRWQYCRGCADKATYRSPLSSVPADMSECYFMDSTTHLDVHGQRFPSGSVCQQTVRHESQAEERWSRDCRQPVSDLELCTWDVQTTTSQCLTEKRWRSIIPLTLCMASVVAKTTYLQMISSPRR